MSACKRLDLGTLGCQPVVMPKNLPGHCSPPLLLFARFQKDYLQLVVHYKLRNITHVAIKVHVTLRSFAVLT